MRSGAGSSNDLDGGYVAEMGMSYTELHGNRLGWSTRAREGVLFGLNVMLRFWTLFLSL